MVNIFIANLDWSITSEDLKTTFSSFGDVHYAHVVFEKDTKRSRGYGYIEMEDANAAIAAISALNGIEINGRAIDVKVASPKPNRPKKEIKEVKKEESKFFKKKPFGFKSDGNKKYGEKKYSDKKYEGNKDRVESSNYDRSSSYSSPKPSTSPSFDPTPSKSYDSFPLSSDPVPSSSEQKSDRVMRPRKRMNDGEGDKSYEKVERVIKRSEENE